MWYFLPSYDLFFFSRSFARKNKNPIVVSFYLKMSLYFFKSALNCFSSAIHSGGTVLFLLMLSG